MVLRYLKFIKYKIFKKGTKSFLLANCQSSFADCFFVYETGQELSNAQEDEGLPWHRSVARCNLCT